MFKIIVFFIIFLLASNKTNAFYTLTLYSTLIEESDLIVVGKIIAINESTFEISTQKNIKGNISQTHLLINKFENWSCAKRISKYEIGQEAIYFLKKNINLYEIIGAGNEGEVLKNNNLYCLNYINHKIKKYYLEENIITEGIQEYLFYQNYINDEFDNYFSRTKVFKNSFLDNLYKFNEFFRLVIIQRNELENHKLDTN